MGLQTAQMTFMSYFAFICGRVPRCGFDFSVHRTQLVQIAKICQKFVKLTHHTYSCLTNFENEAHAMNGNENNVNLLKLAWKIRKITSGELIFGGFEP